MSSQSSCESCSQRSDNNDSYSYNGGDDDNNSTGAPRGAQYRPNDHCKRHRQQDGEEKTEEVVGYRRRKPV